MSLLPVFAWCHSGQSSNSDNISIKPKEAVSLRKYSSFKNGKDWAPAFEKALKECDCVFVPKGIYYCSPVKIPSGKIIQGSGSNTIFRPLDTKLFIVNGSQREGQPIAKDIVDFSNVCTLKNIKDLTPGDDIMIVSQRNSMLKEGMPGENYDPDWVLGRTRKTSVFFGEFDNVLSIDGITFTTYHNRVFPHYFKDNSHEPEPPTEGFRTRKSTSVYKLEMIKNVILRNFSVEGTAKCYQVISLKYAKDCILDNIHFRQGIPCYKPDGKEYLTLVHAYLCRDIIVKYCTSTFSKKMVSYIWNLKKAYVNFSKYNIFKIISCWDSGFDSCTSNCATHGFSITRGSSSITSITGGRCYIRNCVSSNNIWSGVTVQQGVLITELSGNKVTASGQGICCAGRCSIIRNNIVSTDLPFSTHYYYTHIETKQNGQNVMWGGTGGIVLNEGYSCGTPSNHTIVENNVIKGFYTAISIRDGYENKNIFEQGHITIRGNKARKIKVGVGVYKNGYNKTDAPLDLRIEGNDFVCL
ncbi:MAG: hypothetical protein KBS95_05290 [Alistipes sp.]|nr:hypothetical protein [Candidatus Alistipes equi]